MPLESAPKVGEDNSFHTAKANYPLDFSLRSSPIPFQRKGIFVDDIASVYRHIRETWEPFVPLEPYEPLYLLAESYLLTQIPNLTALPDCGDKALVPLQIESYS